MKFKTIIGVSMNTIDWFIERRDDFRKGSSRSCLPFVRFTISLSLCWIKQLITLHCGTRRQWQPFLLFSAAYKAEKRSTVGRNRWIDVRCTYTTSTRSSNSHSGTHDCISFLSRGSFRLFCIIPISRCNFRRVSSGLLLVSKEIAMWSMRLISDWAKGA